MRAEPGLRWILPLALLLSSLQACSCGEDPVAPGALNDPDAGLADSDGGGCAFSGTCDPGGSNPCQQGELGCAADGTQLCTPKNLPEGSGCGTDQVCAAGECVACKPGGACTEPGNACRIGALACDSGPSCNNVVNAPDGTSCGAGQVCQGGACAACVQGATCTDPADPCRVGTQDCTAGIACTNLGPAPNGTTCGQNRACLNGGCVCEPGGPCNNGNPCQTGTATCDASGNPQCGNLANAPDGTSCGDNMACVSGSCQCRAGASCTLPGQPCKRGTIDCGTGTPICTAGGDVRNGTSCGQDRVCNAGSCVSCKGGDACIFGVCQLGTTSCASGTLACADPNDANDGTLCDTNATPGDEVCRNGTCRLCTSGTACNPGGNVCRVGVTDCASGQQQCGNVQDAPEGTLCGANSFCQAGTCRVCQQGAACNPNGNRCLTGTLDCAGGAPVCVQTGTVANGTGCGNNKECQGGVCECTNPCGGVGQSSCAGNTTLNTCVLDPQSGCLENRTTQCAASQVCQGGACVCNDDCTTEGAAQCASATTIQTCTKDANGCLRWTPSPAVGCPGLATAVACTGGACACPAPTGNELFVNGTRDGSGRPRGNDLYGNGSATCPFATIGKSLAQAVSGQTIRVAPGTYAAESFPLTIPDGVTVQGATLRGDVGDYTLRGDGASGGRRVTVVSNGGRLVGFRLRPAQTDEPDTVGVLCNAGSPQFDMLDVRDYADGLYFDGTCTPVLLRVSVSDCSAGGGQAGVVIAGASSAQITDSSIRNNKKTGILIDSVSTAVTLLTRNGNVTNSNNDGISANDEHGVHCRGSSKVRSSSSKYFDNGFAGFFAEESCDADLSGVDCNASNRNVFGCNMQQSASWADLTSSSTVPVRADHNAWKNNPPQSGNDRDYVVRTGAAGIVVSNTCGTSGC